MPLKSLIRSYRRRSKASASRRRELPVDAGLSEWCSGQADRLDLDGLVGAVRVCWNSRMRTTAGRAFWPDRRIELNPKLREFPEEETWNTLKHELAHLIAYERSPRRKVAPHGAEWQQACADLGIAGESVCHNLPFPRQRRKRKHAYRCRSCEVVVKRVKPFYRAVACYDCCRRFSRGRYDDRFRLVKMPIEAE